MNREATGKGPPPAEPSGRHVCVLRQGVNLLFERIKTFVQVIHWALLSAVDQGQGKQAESIAAAGVYEGRRRVSTADVLQFPIDMRRA